MLLALLAPVMIAICQVNVGELTVSLRTTRTSLSSCSLSLEVLVLLKSEDFFYLFTHVYFPKAM